MNRHLLRALGVGPEEPEAEMSEEDREKVINELQVYADDARTDVFRRIKHSALRIVKQAYLALKAESGLLPIGREQGVIIGLEAFLDDYETAQDRLEALVRDTGSDGQDGPANPD